MVFIYSFKYSGLLGSDNNSFFMISVLSLWFASMANLAATSRAKVRLLSLSYASW